MAIRFPHSPSISMFAPCAGFLYAQSLVAAVPGALAGPLPFSIFTLSVGELNTIWMRMALTFISSALTTPHISNCLRDINI